MTLHFIRNIWVQVSGRPSERGLSFVGEETISTHKVIEHTSEGQLGGQSRGECEDETLSTTKSKCSERPQDTKLTERRPDGEDGRIQHRKKKTIEVMKTKD